MDEIFTKIFTEFPTTAINLLVIYFCIRYMRDKDDKFVSALEKQGQENREILKEIAKENRDSNEELAKTLQRIDILLTVESKKQE